MSLYTSTRNFFRFPLAIRGDRLLPSMWSNSDEGNLSQNGYGLFLVLQFLAKRGSETHPNGSGSEHGVERT